MNSVGITALPPPGGPPRVRARVFAFSCFGDHAHIGRDGGDAHPRASCRRDAYMTRYDTTNTTSPSMNDSAAA